VLLALVVGLVAIPFALLVQQVRSDGPLTDLDADVADRWYDLVHGRGPLEGAVKAVSFLGSTAFLTVVVTIGLAVLVRRQAWRVALFLLVTSLAIGFISRGVKEAVGRARPLWDDPIAVVPGNSFPSGHAMGSLVCYGALLVALLPLARPSHRRRWVVATAILVLAIGLSRLGLGVHYASDVLGGYVLGTAWLVGSIALFEVWRAERGRPTTDPLEEGLGSD
jgi:undecaprenyl-diphosphatase